VPIDLRASRLPLLTRCSGPAYLPTEEDTSENLEKANAWGHMVHHWKETGKVNGPDKRTENAFTRAIRASQTSRDELWPSQGHHETAVALSIDGTRQALSTHDGVAGLDNWITGTDDFHWYLLEDELWIDDLKTGKWYDDGEGNNRYPQDVRSAQLRFYALAISVLLNYTGRVHVSLTHWPRLPLELRHAKPVRYWTEYHTDELQKFWGELEALYQRVTDGRKGVFDLNPGDHCRFCPARTNCLVAQEPEPPPTYYRRNH
jgi:hypothetical protein